MIEGRSGCIFSMGDACYELGSMVERLRREVTANVILCRKGLREDDAVDDKCA